MTIYIKDLKLESIIGVYERERTKKQPIIINLEIKIKYSKAHLTDKINDTVDYNTLQKKISDFVSNSKFFLIETLGYKIMELVLEQESIYKAYIEIQKPQAIDNGNISLSYKGKRKKDEIIIY